MKLTVEFPSVSYREGPQAVRRLARTVEQIGYDHIDVFDHVVMGYPGHGRPPGPYTATMPILEALMLLSHVAAVTERVTLGTEVLVLPQRHPTLVAKQVSTLDTLSGGRMDEAIRLLRAYWSEPQVDAAGPHYPMTALAMEPKPPQGSRLPIWIGGMSEAAYRRVGRLGDGWLASRITDAASARDAIAAIHRHAEAAGRDPRTIGLQSMVAPPPRDAEGKRFYAEHDRVVARVAELKAMGFDWVALNATAVFQAGARSVDAMLEALATLHDRIRKEVA
jgi:alkanesulfonate monooxygenase SsuD/methylene tetrahydromethanopterin reductase-like flavin-dependent oxidoreductase (luciferase family)